MENYVRYFIKILVIMVLIALMGLFIVLVKDNTNISSGSTLYFSIKYFLNNQYILLNTYLIHSFSLHFLLRHISNAMVHNRLW